MFLAGSTSGPAWSLFLTSSSSAAVKFPPAFISSDLVWRFCSPVAARIDHIALAVGVRLTLLKTDDTGGFCWRCLRQVHSGTRSVRHRRSLSGILEHEIDVTLLGKLPTDLLLSIKPSSCNRLHICISTGPPTAIPRKAAFSRSVSVADFMRLDRNIIGAGLVPIPTAARFICVRLTR